MIRITFERYIFIPMDRIPEDLDRIYLSEEGGQTGIWKNTKDNFQNVENKEDVAEAVRGWETTSGVHNIKVWELWKDT